MEGKLIKTGDQFLLRNKEDEVIAITSGTMEGRMLSLKNCQAIELGYDLDELALSHVNDHLIKGTDEYHNSQVDFKEGFQKALEILGDKKFSEKDMLIIRNKFVDILPIGDVSAWDMIKASKDFTSWFDNYIQSLQQTEWDVVVERETVISDFNGNIAVSADFKLDGDGCLILKRK